MTPTPGPWSVDRRASTYVTGPDGRGICSTGGYHDSRIDPDALTAENQANARLIAAAPELLDVVKGYVAACIAQDIKLGAITGDAQELIARIEGRQP